MMHWKATFVLLALASATLAGCSQPIYLRDCDELTTRVGVPPDIACNTKLSCERATPEVPRPTDIRDPECTPMYVTLHQCIALALEHGTTGLQTSRNFGLLDDDLITSQAVGGQYFGDSIRVLALNPAIIATNIDFNMARYDPVARTIIGATSQDNPEGSQNAIRNGQYANFGASIEQAFASGGSGSILFGSPTNQGISPATNFYSRFAEQSFLSGTLNPQYTPTLTFAFDQPLLFGFGSEINSLLAQHPEVQNNIGAQTVNHSIEGTQSGILIARLKFTEERADFERSVNFMLANVEVAYWNLYGAFVNLFSSEQALRQAHTAWKINKAKYEAGSIAITQYAQIRGQYEQFRGDRLVALGQVLDAERTLRGLLGLPAADGTRLVPVDTPTVAPYRPDWVQAEHECLTLRPELAIQRSDLKQKQFELIREKNGLLPDFRLGANYSINGAGGTLDGDGAFNSDQSNNALKVLASDRYTDFTIGIYGNMPLGFRAQNAAVRAAKLRLAQSYLQLRDEEERARRYLVQQYRAVIQDYDVIQARHQQREAFAEQVEARFKEFVAGKTTADFLLQAQRDWANAVSVEYQAIVEYNNALVRFQFAKGTLMQFNGIQIAEGALPQCVQVRAVENERQRAAAIALRQEAYGVNEYPSGNPILPSATAAPLPVLIQSTPPAGILEDYVTPKTSSEIPGMPPVSLPPASSLRPLGGPKVSSTALPTPTPAQPTAPSNVSELPPSNSMAPSMPAAATVPAIPASTTTNLQPPAMVRTVPYSESNLQAPAMVPSVPSSTTPNIQAPTMTPSTRTSMTPNFQPPAIAPSTSPSPSTLPAAQPVTVSQGANPKASGPVDDGLH